MSLTIVKYPNPVLKQTCEPVTEFSSELHAQLDEMLPLMKANNGMGLAANQVGITKRFFIMLDKKGQLHEFINPVLVEGEPVAGAQINEGCLSAPGVFVQVPRLSVVTVRAQNRHGEEFTVVAEGVEAVCVQHELDHLNGEFFLEKTSRNQRRLALRQLGLK